ncbi:MAG: hypothetical protein JWQ66_4165 [Mucilaginibacter sp.]|nr:hypothetical protein [Mucilaginibacter sp.]
MDRARTEKVNVDRQKAVAQGIAGARVGTQGIYLADNRSGAFVHKEQPEAAISFGRKLNGAVIQRQKIPVKITGITHLVLAAGKSIYRGREYMEVDPGFELEIDNARKLRSRRGPNQETFGQSDEKNRHYYRWFKVFSVNGLPVHGDVYVRDDAIQIEDRSMLGHRGTDISRDGTQRTRQSLTGAVRLREKYPPGQFGELYESGLIEKFESIQMLLKNTGAVLHALSHLENISKGLIDRHLAERPTQALNIALYEMEMLWMGKGFFDLRESAPTQMKSPKPTKNLKPNPDREKIIQHSDPIAFQMQFLEGVVQKVVPFKDVGAPLPHGEYAHRIQWYIIAFYYLANWRETELRNIYRTLGQTGKYIQKLDFNPKDMYRTLWDYVVDLRRNEPKEVDADAEKSYMGSPIMISTDLLGFSGAAKPIPGKLVKNYPVIAHAIANRRRKRALERKLEAWEKDKGNNKELEPSELEQLKREGGWEKREEWLRGKMPEHFKTDFTKK